MVSFDQPTQTIGQNLQVANQIFLQGAAPGTGLTVSVTSNDPARLLLSTSPTAQGTGSLSLSIPGGGRQTPVFYVQALAGSGTAQVTADAGGSFGTATDNVTFGPSGFIIFGPQGPGNPIRSSPGTNTTVTVSAVLLNAQLSPLSEQQLRGGLTASVPVTSSNPAFGTITTSPVQFSGGVSSATTQFHAVANGSTVLSAGTPAGFATPSSSTTVSATVTTPSIQVQSMTIGQNLQALGTVFLTEPAPSGGLTVTVSSANSAQLLVSANPTTAGSASITLPIPEGGNSAFFYLQALASTGTVNYTAAGSGYISGTATVTFAASGLSIQGPFGSSLLTRVGSAPSMLAIQTNQLDASGNVALTQQLRGGFSVTANINVNPASLGTVTSPVTISGGSDTATSNFTASAAGMGTINLVQPGNFGLSVNQRTVQVTVNP